MNSRLFSNFTLRGLELPNRIVISPMGQYSAEEGGYASQWHLVHLGHLSLSGAGLLITEATAVHPNGRISRHDLGLWSDDHAAALEPVIAFCRKHGGAKLGMQLYHAGRKGSVTVAWEGQRPIPEQGGWRSTVLRRSLTRSGHATPWTSLEYAKSSRHLLRPRSAPTASDWT
jgi:2,4-dienoyl-CoA reductase-like NADH-dependent reductase (Old Yellow Enzyme family)